MWSLDKLADHFKNMPIKRTIDFEYRGEPKPQLRTRSVVAGGGKRVINYDPQKSRDFKESIKHNAQLYAMEKLDSTGGIMKGPIILEVFLFRGIPKSFSNKKRELAINGMLLPTTKPDMKNYISGVEDALEGVIFENDSQIIGYGHSAKLYGDPPGVLVWVHELDVQGAK